LEEHLTKDCGNCDGIDKSTQKTLDADRVGSEKHFSWALQDEREGRDYDVDQ